MYYWPTMADMLGSLPPGEQAELIGLIAGSGAPGAAWLSLTPEQWELIAATARARPPGPRKDTPHVE